MLDLFSNQTKALLIAEDISEMAVVAQQNCITLQHFDYSCFRNRNELGEPYGSTISAILQFSIKSMSGNICKFLYERMKDNSAYSYTFVFNATFDSQKHLAHYDDAMVASGYVVDVEEAFSTTFSTGADTEQMTMNVKLLLTSLVYIGKSSNKTLLFVD